MQEINTLKRLIDRLTAKIEECSCLGFENQTNGRTCDDCLYFASQIDYCWKKNEHQHWAEPCCCDFVDYEKWFEKNGIKEK